MDIRKAYLDFFASKNHEVTPSSPLVPSDATLLFANAGMVPFKGIFTGNEQIPNPPRKTSCQTCIRAGGKHNDLDNVGYTARHHTFFEMLGNFSFGDYFKEQAIAYAWEFVTEVLKLPKDRLYVTVHENDDEAFNLWQKHIQKERIYKFGDKDNFWQMGDTGPCGPCSEIFYDQGQEHFNSSEDYMGGDGDRFLEIWNLVFMQYERSADGVLSPLPKPSIDTGMGLERVTAIKEGKFSNFDSSLFMPIINEISKLCNKTYVYESGASFRVIADHIRTSVFLLAQGLSFDKEGRGYVLRRIVRRALRHGYLLGFKQAFMYKLVDVVCDLMGKHYTYLNEKKDFIKEQLFNEEEKFLSTIEKGIVIFNEELKNTKDVFSANVAFKLYDTYGFPLDLTIDMLREKNISLNEDEFNELMNKQKMLAKASWKGSGDKDVSGDFKLLLEKFGENNFLGYEKTECKAKILALLDDDFKQISSAKNNAWVLFDNSVLYATSGGQNYDLGSIFKDNKKIAEVKEVEKFYDLNLAYLQLNEEVKINDEVLIKIDEERRFSIAKNHSATHLLHYALREVLGPTATQAGSFVDYNRLRFDFNYTRVLNKEELEKIQTMVNDMIYASYEADIKTMSIEQAKQMGAMALFDTKYKENVRVLKLGKSIELCGGTHVRNSADIGLFVITKESALSSGVRRIEALTSKYAYLYLKNQADEFNLVKQELKSDNLVKSFANLKNEIKELKNALKNSKEDLTSSKINNVEVCISEFNGFDLKSSVDDFKNKHNNSFIVLLSSNEDKTQVVIGSKNCNIKANDFIKLLGKEFGGGGGGRDDFSSGALKNTNIKEVIEFIKINSKEINAN
ncbi:alanine--tRNA ligase [Campylobacter canadensis]|uniref:alanine--tRNA ligase n=1 Tax=Campylobacter canadensis TaxID=449520 RepID=UPI0015533F5A|nr:alanine--tRNA ligase [Campylobacter canadensis]MBZ7995139.1 alanine--tRNA ligase [Campylobacter canadensis]MBZ7996579.1 alanine--tRNA ligase [Campylobacter canadensis]MBZ8000508.1 alanine--tRNA ligase [Campylobacter canadensis]MBZ8001905.1 alanine--tRNA ligase [Campylobacter canadensis]MBZ8004375.1 alanine--tRNA ligase [Campylobacter canadensis]